MAYSNSKINQLFINPNERFALLSNQLAFRIQKQGLWGIVPWGFTEVVRAGVVPAATIWRKRIGGSVYDLFSVLMWYLLVSYFSVIDQLPPMGEWLKNLGQKLDGELQPLATGLHVVSYYARGIPEAFYLSLNPLRLLGDNFIYGVFLLWVVANALANLWSHQILPEKQKPPLDHRGDSWLTRIMQKSDTVDVQGLIQRFGEPVLTILLGYVLKLVNTDMGWLLIFSGICLLVQEIKNFNKKSAFR